jgi:hypothetical protein
MDATTDFDGESEGFSTEQTPDWEQLGPQLLAEWFGYQGDALREEWAVVAKKASSGEPVTRRDWERLSRELQTFAYLVDLLGESFDEGGR